MADRSKIKPLKMVSQGRLAKSLALLVASMTIGAAVLLLMQRADVPQTAFSLSTVDRIGSIESIWETTVPVDADRWHTIIIEQSGTTDGNAATLGRLHVAEGLGSLGYHFVIGNGRGCGDGEIQVGVRWDRQLPAASLRPRGPAPYGLIYVCLIGDFSKTVTIPPGGNVTISP